MQSTFDKVKIGEFFTQTLSTTVFTYIKTGNVLIDLAGERNCILVACGMYTTSYLEGLDGYPWYNVAPSASVEIIPNPFRPE